MSQYWAIKLSKISMLLSVFFASFGWLWFVLTLLVIIDTRMAIKAVRNKAKIENINWRLRVTSNQKWDGIREKLIGYSLVFFVCTGLDRCGMEDWTRESSVYLFDFLNTFTKYFDVFKPLFQNNFVGKAGIICMMARELDSMHEKYYLIRGENVEDSVIRSFKRIWVFTRLLRAAVATILDTLAITFKKKQPDKDNDVQKPTRNPVNGHQLKGDNRRNYSSSKRT